MSGKMTLGDDEYRILDVLYKQKRLEIEELAKNINKKPDDIRRSLEFLRSHGLIDINVEEDVMLEPGQRLKKLGGLPEVLLYNFIISKGKISYKNVLKSRVLPSDDLKAAIGVLKKLNIIRISREDDDIFLEILSSMPEDRVELTNKLFKEGRVRLADLAGYDDIIKELAKRPGLVSRSITKKEYMAITRKGETFFKKLRPPTKEEHIVTALTPDLIRTGRWRVVKFKEYDVTLKAPPIFGGRKHPIRMLIDEIREIFISMGFIEEWGPLIELAFWNFDALFQPQDHPAREMHDTFYLKTPRFGSLQNTSIVNRVKSAHESGGNTGSIGWGYKWSEKEAKKYVLRTHTTSITVKKVYEYGEKRVKIFAIGKVFRNESIDYKHLAEFYNVDGIVIDPEANLRELIGILRIFFKRLGFKKILFWPSYFPYTEPSIQVTIYDEKTGKYLEMAGSGIFRPEVTIPLGVKWPVLAWGIGIERILMLRHGIMDIRTIYANDLGWLRGVKLCP